MKVLVAAVVIVAACIGTASSEPAVQKTESAWTEMLPVVTAGVCDAGTMNLDTKGHHPLGHESNINFEVSTDKKAQLDFYWKNEVGLTVQNTPEAVVLEGFNSHTVFKGTNYSVKQIRFHSQSQVEVNSQPAAMDAEVVHKSAEGKAFVLVILFDKGAAKNAALEKMPWDRVQNAQSKATAHQAINIDYLLPKTWAYYHYLGALKGSGSDTECSQQVPYVVMHYRSVLTQAQLSQFPTSSKYKASSRKTKTPAIMYNQFYFAAMHQPQDCLVGAWGAHGACSKSCGGGTKSRTRTLSPPKHGGAACSQSTTSQASCNTQPCPINCVVSSWAAYGECSKSCGGGTKHRQRTITTAPQHGGTACASTTSSASCRTQPCPVDCALSSWGGWRSCSKVCGGGTKSRSRTVRTQPAHGGTACAAVSETRSCNTQPCPVNCLVGSWASWGSCSKTCAGGTHSTSRPVTRQAAHGGVACPSLSKSRVCNTTPCPIHCTVSSWARWSSCTKTCGSGTSQRARSITKAAAHGGNSCANTKETKQCNTHKCAVHCAVSSWGGWGSCSKACGGGTRTRRRTVTRNAAHGGNACGALSTTQGCNAQACPTRSPTRTPTRTPTRVPTRTPTKQPVVTRTPTRSPTAPAAWHHLAGEAVCSTSYGCNARLHSGSESSAQCRALCAANSRCNIYIITSRGRAQHHQPCTLYDRCNTVFANWGQASAAKAAGSCYRLWSQQGGGDVWLKGSPGTNFFHRAFPGGRNNWNGEVGYKFRTKRGFQVSALGRSLPSSGSLTRASTVSIWDASTRRKVASVAVGPSSPRKDGYAYEFLSSAVSLSANKEYRISEVTTGGMDKWNDASDGSLSNYQSAYAAFQGGVYCGGSNCGYPTNSDGSTRRPGMVTFYVK